jgi:hypothetical protein
MIAVAMIAVPAIVIFIVLVDVVLINRNAAVGAAADPGADRGAVSPLPRTDHRSDLRNADQVPR